MPRLAMLSRASRTMLRTPMLRAAAVQMPLRRSFTADSSIPLDPLLPPTPPSDMPLNEIAEHMVDHLDLSHRQHVLRLYRYFLKQMENFGAYTPPASMHQLASAVPLDWAVPC